MKKKFIEIVWEQPAQPLVRNRFDAEKFNVTWDNGVCRVKDEDGHPVVMIPEGKVQLVQFGEEEVESPIISPHAVPRVPTVVPQ